MRRTGMRRGLVRGILLASLALAASPVAADPPPNGDVVVLKSGKVLQGRVVGKVTVGKATLLRIETDFGQILVPDTDAKTRPAAHEDAADAPFAFEEIRILEISGRVLRRPAGETQWTPIAEPEYGKDAVSRVEILPGDSLRTERGGVLSFMPHKDVWIRMAPETEVEITLRGRGASLALLSGDLVAKIAAPPRQREVRIRMPGTLLGTREGLIILGSHDGTDSIGVKTGSAQVIGGMRVSTGSAVDQRAGGPTVPRTLSSSESSRAAFDVVPRPDDDMIYVPPGSYALGWMPVQFTASTKGSSIVGIIPHMSNVNTGDNLGQFWWARGTEAKEPSGFLVDRRKVTVAEFARFAAATNRGMPRFFPASAITPELAGRPVAGVTWEEARAFAHWCRKELPSGIEWEMAAKGPEESPYPWGWQPRDQSTWYRGTWWPYWESVAIGKTIAIETDKIAPMLKALSAPEGPTIDVSPFGMVGAVTPPLEWTRDRAEEVSASIPAPLLAGIPAKDCPVYRGIGVGDFRFAPMEPEAQRGCVVGLRCVRRLK